jgi:hypothetical protein
MQPGEAKEAKEAVKLRIVRRRISLPSGATMRLPPPRRWSSKRFRLPTR